jgi:hypothetical protein
VDWSAIRASFVSQRLSASPATIDHTVVDVAGHTRWCRRGQPPGRSQITHDNDDGAERQHGLNAHTRQSIGRRSRSGTKVPGSGRRVTDVTEPAQEPPVLACVRRVKRCGARSRSRGGGRCPADCRPRRRRGAAVHDRAFRSRRRRSVPNFLAHVAAREPVPPSAPHVPTNHRMGFAVLISTLAKAR